MQRVPEKGLEIFSAGLVAMLSALGGWGRAGTFCLGWQRLGMPERVNACCNLLPRQAAGLWRCLVWVVLLCFPYHHQCPDTGLTFGLGTPRRNNHGSAMEDLHPVRQLMGFLGALDITQLIATGEA